MFGGRKPQLQALSEEEAALFMEWLTAQEIGERLRLLGCLSLLADGLDGSLPPIAFHGKSLPNVWAMAWAAQAARDAAQAAGLAEMTVHFESEYRWALSYADELAEIVSSAL